MTVIPNLIRDLIKIFLNLIFYVINKFCSVINLRGFFLYGQLFAWFNSAHQSKTRLSKVPLSTAASLLRNCFAAFPILVAYNAKSIFAKKRLLKIRSLFVSYTGFAPVTHALKVWDNSKKDLISILITALFYTSICN